MAGPISTDNFTNQFYTREKAYEAIEIVRQYVVGFQFNWTEVNTGNRIILGINPVYKDLTTLH